MTTLYYLLSAAVGSGIVLAAWRADRPPTRPWSVYALTIVAGCGAGAMLGVTALMVSGVSHSTARTLFLIGRVAVAVVAGGVLADWTLYAAAGRHDRILVTPAQSSSMLALGSRLLMASYYGFTATFSWTQPQRAYRFFQASGYSHGFFVFIAVWESVGALGLLFPRSARFAAMALFGEMIGAVATHLHNAVVSGMPLGDTLDALKMLPVLAYIAVGVRRAQIDGDASDQRSAPRR